MQWYEAFELPQHGNMMGSGSDAARQHFIRVGTSIFKSIEGEIIDHFGSITDEMQILDFGCGNGRVALPFYHAHEKPTAAVDPNPDVIAYLKRTFPAQIPKKPSRYRPCRSMTTPLKLSIRFRSGHTCRCICNGRGCARSIES